MFWLTQGIETQLYRPLAVDFSVQLYRNLRDLKGKRALTDIVLASSPIFSSSPTEDPKQFRLPNEEGAPEMVSVGGLSLSG